MEKQKKPSTLASVLVVTAVAAISLAIPASVLLGFIWVVVKVVKLAWQQ